MIIRRSSDVHTSDRHVFGASGTWDSQRYVLAGDGVGFSFHITTLYEGMNTPLWYKNHVEMVYVISGELNIKWASPIGDIDTILDPGDMYLLDKHDKHMLIPLTNVTVACVFNPPVVGTEDHDADGSYELVVDTVNEEFKKTHELNGVAYEFLYITTHHKDGVAPYDGEVYRDANGGEWTFPPGLLTKTLGVPQYGEVWAWCDPIAGASERGPFRLANHYGELIDADGDVVYSKKYGDESDEITKYYKRVLTKDGEVCTDD